jgi:hypothetical protein
VGAHGFLLPAQVHVRWADEALGKMIAVLQAMPLEQEVALLAAEYKSMYSGCKSQKTRCLLTSITSLNLLPRYQNDTHQQNKSKCNNVPRLTVKVQL